MKSTEEDLRKRGMASREDKEALAYEANEILIETLHDINPGRRSAAAAMLKADSTEVCEALLKLLAQETCLYTRLAICESLEKGGCVAAKKMIAYLGKIGTNQHKELPDKVSAKKSFPLPRDLIARSLGRMDPEILPILLEVLGENDLAQVSEVLDAIGYMVFYHPVLATKEHLIPIMKVAHENPGNKLILWKIILCLSAFPLQESKVFLLSCIKGELYSKKTSYIKETRVIALEAQRSLKMLERSEK